MGLNAQKVLKDPIYFVENIIGMKLPEFQKEWFRLMDTHKRVCLMAFRTSGKTRQLFVHYFLWKAITCPTTEYAIISKTLPQAIAIMKDIRLTVLTNKMLRTLIPSNRSQSWSRTEIELSNHSRILVRPYNENIRGLHVSGVGTDEMGEYDDHSVFRDAVLPTIRAKRGFFIGVGTPRSELDLLHQIERDPSFSSIFFDRYPAEGEKGNLFEMRYPDAEVVHGDSVQIVDKKTKKLLETYSNMTWSQEFLLRPVSMKDKLFPDHMITACLDPKMSFSYEPENMRQYFMGIDFAMSAQSGSDFTAMVLLEKSPASKKLKIVNVERFRGMDYNAQKIRIKEFSEKYQIIKALGDENSFGRVFIQDLRNEGVPIEGYSINNRSKEDLIKALRDQFEKEGFIIPFDQKDMKTQIMIKTLIDELTKFGITFDMRTKCVKFEGTGEHDDMVIGLSLANFIARNVSMSLFAAIKGHQRNPNMFHISTH